MASDGAYRGVPLLDGRIGTGILNGNVCAPAARARSSFYASYQYIATKGRDAHMSVRIWKATGDHVILSEEILCEIGVMPPPHHRLIALKRSASVIHRHTHIRLQPHQTTEQLNKHNSTQHDTQHILYRFRSYLEDEEEAADVHR